MAFPSPRTAFSWIAQLTAAGILAMAAITKLTSAPEPMVLFTILGAEPWGRLLVGALELVAALLLIWPRTAAIGAGVGATVMLGAIGTHLFKIGLNYGGNPSLFVAACVVLAACLTTLVLRRPHSALRA